MSYSVMQKRGDEWIVVKTFKTYRGAYSLWAITPNSEIVEHLR